MPLVAGNATVVASNVNVRGQAKLKSEVITRLNKGQEVAVLEEVTLKKSGPDEPSAWAKITLSPKTHVWVNTSFVEGTLKDIRDSNTTQGSCVRMPNGQDTDDLSADWSFSMTKNPSPGAPNQ